MSAANRRRGADAERAVCTYLRQWWPDARRYLAGDGKQPGDIDAIPGVCIEVKDVARSAWTAWRAQAIAEAGERYVIVVRRTRGVRDVGQWVAQIPYGDWHDFGGEPRQGNYCPRTQRVWLHTTFADITHLLREDTHERHDTEDHRTRADR